MARLVVEAVASATELRRGLSPGAAEEYGRLEDGDLVVDDDDAQMLVDTYPNVRWADAGHATDTMADEPAPRADFDGDGVEYRCGVNDCSREVESPEATCWQHGED